MKTVNLQLTQGDAFFRFNLQVENMNEKEVATLLCDAVLTFHTRYTKFVKGKTKSYNVKFGKPFTMNVYLEGVKSDNGTFYHSTNNFFFNVENVTGTMDVTNTITKAERSKVGYVEFIQDWMSDIFDGRKCNNIEEVLHKHTCTVEA
jgi:hypothetical protein